MNSHDIVKMHGKKQMFQIFLDINEYSRTGNQKKKHQLLRNTKIKSHAGMNIFDTYMITSMHNKCDIINS